MSAIRGLYAIADPSVVAPHRLTSAAAEAIAGGARVVQYRGQDGDARETRRQAAALAALCRRTRTVFIVNDDAELAAEMGADGVHIGVDDASIEYTRAVVGGTALIGLSCYNQLPRALDGARRGVDYVAFGSFYPSAVKPNAVRALPELLRRARGCVDLPIVAIGGITPENGGALVKAGADALAVISAVFAASDPRTAAARFAALFTNAK